MAVLANAHDYECAIQTASQIDLPFWTGLRLSSTSPQTLVGYFKGKKVVVPNDQVPARRPSSDTVAHTRLSNVVFKGSTNVGRGASASQHIIVADGYYISVPSNYQQHGAKSQTIRCMCQGQADLRTICLINQFTWRTKEEEIFTRNIMSQLSF